MSDYMTLLGAEQVQSAAGTMRSAASEMQRAASEISGAFEMHQRFLTQWLMDFQTVLETAKETK
jgi:hypothetical protein